MSEMTVTEDGPRTGRRKYLLVLMVLTLAAGGFAASYLGKISPRDLIAFRMDNAADTLAFVEVPAVTVPLAGGARRISVTVGLESSASRAPELEKLMPRITATVTEFLSAISPDALDRRGVLEIIRMELHGRVDAVVDPGLIDDLMITEFAIR
ncbi:flagellar basal body-associated FliL family protein [Paracoccus sp. SCSIO 75233]|uniref:flagellar basal body-associated FliL family protein n=1 Tax=Paracoccus sp. SCSIO 75233 TaxID=3017782 RepID=UPI0022F0D625|nr:flagellar basal body-associated FliL family protein [Paracoccus sp. SCSIO 75233]WBU53132.1 flagellar basal body-associated FliL family protein [Paracoccus sp. SCSIO 75233]